MIVLALDTTSRAGSVAVVHGDVVRVEVAGDLATTHGQRLPLELQRALDDAGVALASVDLFAVVAGPGSFTGLRVGIATIQGLAMAEQKKVVAVSALDVLAFAATNAHHPIGAWIDAQRGEVFAALYAPDGRDVLVGAVSAPPGDVLESWADRSEAHPATFIGDGADRYRDVITRRLGATARISVAPPLAGLAGRIAAAEPERAVRPHAIVPVYVRKSDAELARARKGSGSLTGMDEVARYTISRVTGAGDLDDIAALEAASFSNPWSREMLARDLQNATVSRVYAMRQTGGGLVAFCACWLVADELHINTLAVTHGERRRGLATTLLRHVFDAARAEGMRHATLEVRRSNEAALKLYERLGFEVRAIRKDYYRNPEEDALVLWNSPLRIPAGGCRP